MKHLLRLSQLSVLTLVTACGLDGPVRVDAPPGNGDEQGPAVVELDLVEVEPPAPLDAVPTVLRLHVHLEVDDALRDRARLFEGELSDAQLRQAAELELSASLAERLVATRSWGTEHGLVVAPLQALREGGRYTLALAERRLGLLTVVNRDSAPQLSLRWPPGGASPSGWLGVYCHDDRTFDVETAAVLAPSGITGMFRSGIAPGEPSRRCVHFEPASVAPVGAAPESLAPPELWTVDGATTLRMDPTPLARSEVPTPPTPPLGCGPEAVPFGPGCALVEDDRILLEAPGAALLWSVQSAPSVGIDQVFSADGGARYLWPFPPDSTVLLAVTTVDPGGGVRTMPAVIRTRPPMPHLVIDEVLANPVGPEPAQEWVELVNDGLVPAELEGVRLADVGGEVVLPAASLAPGERALLVAEAYEASGKFDPAPPEGTRLVRLPRLGKGGLSNSGEPLELLAPDGRVLSRFPALKTKAGRSLYRTHPRSLDGFLESKLGGSTPGAPNGAAPLPGR
ncbi:MAG: lamin tail domain-containing protein [Deltaproteobacteria bacterium]|nr:lamin tail domain-containing protein [Deltaproteobacteria bacterium]